MRQRNVFYSKGQFYERVPTTTAGGSEAFYAQELAGRTALETYRAQAASSPRSWV